MPLAEIVTLCFLAVSSGGAEAPKATQGDTSMLSILQVTESLKDIAKSKSADKKTHPAENAALAEIRKVCLSCLQRDSGFSEMLTSYIAALQAKKDTFSAKQIKLLLDVRNDIRCRLLEKTEGCSEVPANVEALGLCNLFSEGLPYTLVPCNKFIQAQIDKVVSVEEQEYLAIEEQYFGAFDGEYLSPMPFIDVIKRAGKFLKVYPTSCRSANIRGFMQDAQRGLETSKRNGEGALNDGPGARCE